MIFQKIRNIINLIIKELMRLNDKLYIDRVQIKRPKNPEEWTKRFLQIVLDSEFCLVSPTRREKM